MGRGLTGWASLATCFGNVRRGYRPRPGLPGVRIEGPKSRNGKRTLPLDAELVTALTALRKRQLDEGTAAGPGIPVSSWRAGVVPGR